MMNETKIPFKPLFFCLLFLTISGLLVYTAWKMGQEPPERSEPNTRDMAEAVEHPESTEDEQTEPAGAVSSPVSAYPVTERGETEQTEGYLLYREDGALLVLDEKQDVSFPAGLDYELLPEALQQEIDQGKYFDTEEALLEFLENYSS
jgi:hypothetical protein